MISAAGKLQLKEYKYEASSASYLDNLLLGPFWNFLLAYIPGSISPNALTLIGTMFAFLTMPILYLYSSFALAWVATAVCIFLYQTCDALDGKQARKWGKSSALGQVLDHGCDSIVLSVLFYPLTFIFGDVDISLFFCLQYIVFYLYNLEQSVTGKMRFDFISISEAQWAYIITCLITAMFGLDFWIPYRSVAYTALIVSSLVSIISPLNNILHVSIPYRQILSLVGFVYHIYTSGTVFVVDAVVFSSMLIFLMVETMTGDFFISPVVIEVLHVFSRIRNITPYVLAIYIVELTFLLKSLAEIA